MIIGITGTLGAGKGTIVEFLRQREFNHYSVRDFLTEELKKKGFEINRDNMVLLANRLRSENSPSYIVEKLHEKAELETGDCIIESLRTPGEVEALRKKGEFILFAIDADVKTRYSRISLRKSSTDDVSFEEFVENEKREMKSSDPNKQNLSKCIEMADFVFQNNGSIEELHAQIEKILVKLYPKEFVVEKKQDYISWDDYFMGVALLSAQRSKDPGTQVGACIVDRNNHIVGTGYNGFPIGCSDDNLPWSREGDFLDTKYPYVCHAELNAILNSNKTLAGCSIYTALFPCNECTKAIIQSGIREVVYLSDKYAEVDAFKASKRMLNQAGIRQRRLVPRKSSILLRYDNQ